MAFVGEDIVRQRELLEFDQRRADVVMIGSQVVYGSVGLSAAIPVMHNESLRVVAVPTVVLSSMPRYASSHRQPMSDQWLSDTLKDLVDLGIIDEVSTISTGYFASASQVQVVAKWLQGIRETHPHVRIVVDPVMGDSDVGIYVADDIATAICQDLCPLATGIIPNAFEFAHMAGDSESLFGPFGEWIIITSASETAGTTITRIITRDTVREIASATVDTTVKGAGDVYAAALIAALHKDFSLIDAATHASNTVRAGLQTKAL
ncbi:pyridoxal/pyridoxine/pyridoxamine kinase [Corynebacterium suranareeae]|uniref:pyridoxal kinase n=1 Tax=Corynebacterium suranareeae TaxID=2506452 RepID=A0A160PPE2_9CORY|nr:PfkB family carbohydrate kinase [Corynebacterium suranareeae]BAU95294.1 pyridoxal/pyridoxine/pyridoxamine kinase [Corynebacterium suranareeae]